MKNRVTYGPYDITTRVICEPSNDIHIRLSLEQSASGESGDDFYYAVFLVYKLDHRALLEDFRLKWRASPLRAKYSIDLGKVILLP